MKILISCPFWLSSVLNKEIKLLWYKPYDSFDTWTFVKGDIETLYQINLWSRVANKTYIILDEKKITSFDDLFAMTKAIDRKQYVQNFSHITVFAKSKNSQLESEKTIQSITQKAIYNKLIPEHIERLDKEWVPPTDIKVTIFNDHAQLMINATWQWLFKRGYRTEVGQAPIKENLAAGLILLAGRRFKETFIDPFCGSGTIAIEAAMIAKNIAPGYKRTFAFQNFKNYKKSLLDDLKKAAKDKIYPWNYEIYGYDIDPTNIEIAQDNAANAWVQHSIIFKEKNFLTQEFQAANSWILTNPPYGKRLKPEDIWKLYQKLVETLETGKVKWGFITNNPEINGIITHTERKKNYLYNWWEPSTFRRIQHNYIEQDENNKDNTNKNKKKKISPREASILTWKK